MNTISTATKRGKYIDCRKLSMSLMFYKLDISTAYDVVLFAKEELEKILSNDAKFRWFVKDKSCSSQKANDEILKCKGNLEPCWFGFEGLFYSDVVFNNKSYQNYQKEFSHSLNPIKDKPVDYDEEFHRYFTPEQTPEEFKKALVEFMNLPNKTPICHWLAPHDFLGMFDVARYEKHPDLYRGKIQFYVCAESIKNNIEDIANSLKGIIEKITNITANVSGCVSLTPLEFGQDGGYSHMSLFHSFIGDDKTYIKEGFKEYEWAKYSYVCGVEWWNLISPWQKERLSFDASQIRNNVLVDELDGGGLIIRSPKSILDTDIEDLREIKKILYDALYPGKAIILKNNLWDEQWHTKFTKPRCRWANVPIFEEEINVTDEFIEFRHG